MLKRDLNLTSDKRKKLGTDPVRIFTKNIMANEKKSTTSNFA